MSVIKTSRVFKSMPINDLQAAVKAAAEGANWEMVASYGVELKAREIEAKEAAGKAVNFADIGKNSAVLPNGGRMGPKTDVALVIALVANAQFIMRSLPTGSPLTLDSDYVEAIRSTLASNVLCGRSDCSIKSFDVSVLEDGRLRVIGTPTSTSQEDEKGLNVFSVTTTNEGPVKVSLHEVTHQVPVQGSVA